MFQQFNDEVLDTSLQPDSNPRYTIRDNNGNILHDNVSIDLNTPVVQEGTPINKVAFQNLQGDLYTQDKYNIPSHSGNAMMLPLPLTSYETGKVVKIQAPATLENPTLNINSLGEKTVNGSIVINNTYELKYNGTSWDIVTKDIITGTYTGNGGTTESTGVTVYLGFRPQVVIVADKDGRVGEGPNANYSYRTGAMCVSALESIKGLKITNTGFIVYGDDTSSNASKLNTNLEVYQYIAIR